VKTTILGHEQLEQRVELRGELERTIARRSGRCDDAKGRGDERESHEATYCMRREQTERSQMREM